MESSSFADLEREGVMRQRIEIKRSNPAMKDRLLSTLRTYLPGAWIDPRNNELITLYRLRYRMAMEEEKYDTAMRMGGDGSRRSMVNVLTISPR